MNKNEAYYEQIVMACINQKHTDNCTFIYECFDDNNWGELICALSNKAALERKPYAYAIFGIDPKNYTILNCNQMPSIEESLMDKLSSNITFHINQTLIENKNVIVLEVCATNYTSMQYEGEEYIIENSEVQKLKDHSVLEKKLLDILKERSSFDTQIAMKNISAQEILELLDCKTLFSLLEKPYPNSTLEIINLLLDMRFIIEHNTGKYSISNLGALLLAKRLSAFKTIEYKAVRVIKYDGNDYTCSAHEQIGGKGYIIGFKGLISYIIEHLPTYEVIEDGITRKNIPIFPALLIRELVGNAIIHQDLSENGGPIVSIFRDRIEISNPGIPVIDRQRFIDTPPHSRNESLAAAMHKVGFCEERGSGYDKVISYIENSNMPAPEITTYENKTKITLRAKRDFNLLTKDELILACYNHACLNYVNNKPTNNTSLRERFDLTEDERYKISRIFSDTAEKGLIKIKETTGTKNREYEPFWAV